MAQDRQAMVQRTIDAKAASSGLVAMFTATSC